MFLMLLTALASPKGDLKKAEKALDRGEPGAAIPVLQDLTSDPDPALRARAALALARGYLAEFRLAPTGSEELQQRVVDHPVLAAEMLALALDHGETRELASTEAQRLGPLLVTGALEHTLTGLPEGLVRGERWAEAAVALDGSSHSALGALGTAKMARQDTSAAVDAYERAIAVFEKTPPVTPDPTASLLYVKLAALQHPGAGSGDPDRALATLERGLVALDREEGREVRDDPRLLRSYAETRRLLDGVRLDLYRTHPDARDRALVEFEKKCRDEPDNYGAHVAWAQLLEAVDPDAAVATYERAITLQPNAPAAHFSLGALHLSRAVEQARAANESADPAASEAAMERSLDGYRRARPHFEAAYEANPRDLETVRALKRISVTLDDVDAFKGWTDVEKSLR